MKRLFLILLCIGLANSAIQYGKHGDWFTVRTPQGPVRGRLASTGDYYSFYGIHYATAPTGVNRFQAPLPPPVWEYPLDAVDEGIICPQPLSNFVPRTLTQQEDCLIANVYVPNTERKNLSVLVNIHGGDFQTGFSGMEDYINFVRTNQMIVVTFNYRLGVLGFLCLGTEGAPGNAGMKDQVALLRWVSNTIASFGGDPANVSIFGSGSGSTSILYIMASTVSRGLIQKAILIGNDVLTAFDFPPNPLENARLYARLLNFTDDDDIYALEEFLETLSIDVLTSIGVSDSTNSTSLFLPCVERNNGTDVFLDASVLNVLRSGNYTNVPILQSVADLVSNNNVQGNSLNLSNLNRNVKTAINIL